MRRCNILVLLVVTFIACSAVFTHAVNTDNIHCKRNLKGGNQASDTKEDSGAEERAFTVSSISFSQVKAFFSWGSAAQKVVKTSPELAAGMKNPVVGKAVTDLGNNPGFIRGMKESPVMNRISSQLQGRTNSLTTKNIESIGKAAVKSSPAWKSMLAKAWVKYGAVTLLAAGLLFLFTMVAVNLRPR